MRELREQLIKDLSVHEGRSNTVYPDSTPEKHPTIGVGYKLKKHEIGKITHVDDDWIDAKLTETVNLAIEDAKAIMPDFDKHPAHVQRALANLTFNMGRGKVLGFDRTLRYIKDKEYEKASEELLDSKYAVDVKGRALDISMWLRGGTGQAGYSRQGATYAKEVAAKTGRKLDLTEVRF